MTTEALPALPPGVVLVPGHDEEVVAWWRRSYAALVASARYGAPTALAITNRWARAEVEWASARGVEPQVGVPPH